MTKERPRQGAGFTLIELLVVSAIVGMVAAVIGACLVGGIRVWDRARTFAVAEADAAIGLRIVEKDLMNTFPFYGIRFSGEATGMSFPALVATPRTGFQDGGDSGAGRRIGAVKYEFDARKQVFVRQELPYPESETTAGRAEDLLSHLESVSLQYYAPARRGRSGAWQERWDDETNFPRRVRIQLAFTGKDGMVNMTRTVLLPTERTQNSRKK